MKPAAVFFRMRLKQPNERPPMFRTLSASLLLAAGILSASAPAQAADTLMETFFRGKTTATGSFSAINGVRRQFDVKLTGTVRGDMLTLREDFVYKDGERDTKTWRFKRTGPATYVGTREDVIGETVLTVSGNTATFTYLVDLDSGPGENIVRFHDRMTLSKDGKTMENTATVTKYGFPVAIVAVHFRR